MGFHSPTWASYWTQTNPRGGQVTLGVQFSVAKGNAGEGLAMSHHQRISSAAENGARS